MPVIELKKLQLCCNTFEFFIFKSGIVHVATAC